MRFSTQKFEFGLLFIEKSIPLKKWNGLTVLMKHAVIWSEKWADDLKELGKFTKKEIEFGLFFKSKNQCHFKTFLRFARLGAMGRS